MISPVTFVEAPVQNDDTLKWRNLTLTIINLKSSGSSKHCYTSKQECDNRVTDVAVLKAGGSLKKADRIFFEIETHNVLKGHPAIVEVLNSFCYLKNDQIRWIQIQYLYEGDLKDLIERPPSINEILSIFLQLVKGLIYIHSKKVILGDMKPSNILYHHKENRILVVFTDWDGSSLNGQSVSTTRNYKYLPPEQFSNIPPTCQGNIWSLALIISRLRLNSNYFKVPYDQLEDLKDKTRMNLLEYEIVVYISRLNPTPFKAIVERMLNISPSNRPPLIEIEYALDCQQKKIK